MREETLAKLDTDWELRDSVDEQEDFEGSR